MTDLQIQAELTVANAKGVFPSSQVPVTLTVRDRNDNRPKFSQSTYTATLTDCARPGNLLVTDPVITVNDLDQVWAISSVYMQGRGEWGPGHQS